MRSETRAAARPRADPVVQPSCLHPAKPPESFPPHPISRKSRPFFFGVPRGAPEGQLAPTRDTGPRFKMPHWDTTGRASASRISDANAGFGCGLLVVGLPPPQGEPQAHLVGRPPQYNTRIFNQCVQFVGRFTARGCGYGVRQGLHVSLIQLSAQIKAHTGCASTP